MDSSVLLAQMVQLFLIIALGILLYRLKLTTVEFNQRLTKIVLYVTVPALILNSVLSQDERAPLVKVGIMFVIGFAMFFIFPLLAFVIIRVLRFPKADQGLYMFMLVFGNVGFMGFPVISALYGNTAVFYTAIVNIMFNLSCFSVGLVLMHYGQDTSAKFRPRSLLTPGIIGSCAALVLYFADIHFPAVLTGTIGTVGGLTSPLAMLLIGGTLARMEIKSIFNDWHIYLFTLVKQIVLPLAVWPLLVLCLKDDLILHITFILLLMPVANNSILFATNYGGNEELAAKSIFVTTLLSIITIPLLCALLL